MEAEELQQLLAGLRQLGGEPTEIEVKAAAGGLPKSVVDTVAAFSNTNGGLLVLGVDEAHGFQPVVLPDARKLRDDLASALSDQLEPPVRAAIDLVALDDHVVVVAEIAPLPSDQKPCYVASRGIATGSYVRTGDGDRRMSQAEVGLAIANRGQPVYDTEPVSTATAEELDGSAVQRLLERARSASRSLRDVDDERALRRLRILVRDDSGEFVPSLGGMLALGEYPQEFFPQLMVSFVVHGAEDGLGRHPRFLDNQQFRGSIPSWSGKRLRPCGATSPYVPVTVADLGEEGVSSSRNSYLAQILSDTYMPHSDRLVAENRASGVPAMIRDLVRSGLPRPRFDNYPARFEVRFDRSELLDPDTRSWLDEVRRPGFTRLHDLALAMLAHGQEVTNSTLRDFGADRPEATRVLGDLVAAGLATRSGGRRYARYLLAGPRTASQDVLFPDLFADSRDASTYDAVVTAFRRTGRTTAAELARVTGRSRPAVLTVVRKLIEEGRVTAAGAPSSPRRTYTWEA